MTKTIIADKIKTLVADNERINAQALPEVNEKEVNRIYLNTVAQGKTTLSADQTAIVKKIAYQCPLQGGNAVFAARSLYALVEDVNFDDFALCNTKNDAPTGRSVSKIETGYAVTPNPASDLITVSREVKDNEKEGIWTVFDMSGRIVKSWNAVGEKQNMSIQELSEGVYFVSYSLNDIKQFTLKLIKVKFN